ncbi:hypothetical protein [Bradyrhizobium canariense]|uniref:hypothetical protein n=1 Tax=Bradyrhizobium canariense TaxID=255045 RepID=UPI0011773B06|nr:hypothetical protein [Bradyrhizobium canariense]
MGDVRRTITNSRQGSQVNIFSERVIGFEQRGHVMGTKLLSDAEVSDIVDRRFSFTINSVGAIRWQRSLNQNPS